MQGARIIPALMERAPAFPWYGQLWLFGAIFFLYLFSTSGARPWGDATPVWEVADNIAYAHNFHAATRWPMNLPNGKDGHLYGVAPLLQSLVHVPGAALQRLIAQKYPAYMQICWRFTCHLAPTVLGTLACLFFFGLCRRVEMQLFPAALTTLALAFATSLWVYSRYPYSETLQLCCFTGFFSKLLDVRIRPTWRQAAWLGLWAGLLVNAKPVFLVSGLGAGVFLIWELRRNWRTLVLVALVSTAAATPLAAMYLYYNYARWGSITSTGYGVAITITTSGIAALPGVHEHALVGLWGMFLSPGKSIFLYSPPLLVALLGFLRFAKNFRHVVLAMALTILPGLYVHAQMISWAGDYAWGPRYMIFALGVFLLPAGFVVQACLNQVHKLRRYLGVAALSGVLLGGVLVTYLGNAIYWDHFIRIQNEATRFWLGIPNNGGDGSSTQAIPCPVCFETISQLQWLPPFQHIVGNYWLLTHLPYDHDWVRAEEDAPWRRYTNLQVNIKESYARASVDWWFLGFRKAFPVLSWSLAIFLPIASAVMLVLFLLEVWRSSRRARQLLAEHADVRLQEVT
jgi:hypothetical protein